MTGKVWITTGIRVSQNYNSESFEVGLELPIGDGETPVKAMKGVLDKLNRFFKDKAGLQMDMLDNVIQTKRKRS